MSVYLVTCEGMLYALRRTNGEVLWKSKAVDLLMESLQVHDDILLLKLVNSLRAFDRESGKVLWQQELPEHPQGESLRLRLLDDRAKEDKAGKPRSCYILPRSFPAKDGVVYLTQGSKVIAVELKTGDIRWQYDPKITQGSDRLLEDSYSGFCGGRISCTGPWAYQLSPPELAGESTLLFGSEIGLHALNIKKQVELWRIATDSPVSRRPLVVQGGVLFGRDSQRIERTTITPSQDGAQESVEILKDVSPRCYFLSLE
jgi:outer membrane protein assembly factor BamB